MYNSDARVVFSCYSIQTLDILICLIILSALFSPFPFLLSKDPQKKDMPA